MVAVVAAGLSGWGCEKSGPPAPQPQRRTGTIAFIGASIEDPLWRLLYATAYRELEGYSDYQLKVAAPRIASVEAQIDLIHDMRTDDLLGVCILPINPIAIRSLLEELRTQGIIVVTMINRIPSDNEFFFSGVDDLAAGEAMADALRDWVGESGTAAILLSGQPEPHHDMRLVGLRKELEVTATVNVLAELDCGGNIFTARAMLREYMERFPRLNGWVSVSDWPLRRRRPAERVLPPTCRLVTFGATPENWRFLEDDTCYALVGAEYDRVASRAVQTCITAIRGTAPHLRSYLAPPVVVTAENLHRYRTQWFRWRELPLQTQGTSISAQSESP